MALRINKRKITRGTSYALTVEYSKDGEVTSIVGDTLFLTVKDDRWDDDTIDTSAKLSKTVVVADTEEAQAGKYTFSLDRADTYLTPDKYWVDVVISRTVSGNRYALALEQWEITGTPTNRAS